MVEIGCGQGEFLALLREHGIGRATGFDPASRVPPGGDLEIHSKVFSAADMPGDVDFVCCKMTLEHIPDPLQFLQSVHQGLDGNRDARVFFMVPDATRILAEGAFWDIYHEHVLYFTPEILMRVFHNAGFDVCATESEYEGQYCSVIAKPRSRMRAEAPVEPLSAALTDAAYALDRRVEQAIETWASRLGGNGGTARSTAIWGGGSKAVAFLAALGGRVDIAAVVDINPLKHGTYLPSTGIQVIAPEELRRWAPDQILVMNPIYEAEIRERLSELGVRTKILALR